MKFFKYIFLSIFIIIALTPGIILAHTQTEVELNLDFETKILYVKVHHSVDNAKKHYINKIEVYLDDELMIVQNFKQQKDNKVQQVLYILLDAMEGSKIKVKGICNIFGSKTGEMVIEKQKEKG